MGGWGGLGGGGGRWIWGGSGCGGVGCWEVVWGRGVWGGGALGGGRWAGGGVGGVRVGLWGVGVGGGGDWGRWLWGLLFGWPGVGVCVYRVGGWGLFNPSLWLFCSRFLIPPDKLIRTWLFHCGFEGTCSSGKVVVSRAGEAYDVQAKCINRKFRLEEGRQ